MMLEVEIVKALPRFAINLALACESGKLLALVGPSGAGKTTLMRIIAGLERPDHGRISFDAETWLDTGAGVCLSPQRRNLGYVFQEYTLFPHLTVFGNVAFAARDQGSVTELLKRFEIWHLRQRKPRKLSGGERQRVALAQALAPRPRILLLDEPFSALDAVSRRKLQGELGKIKAEFNLPIIHITHDLKEAESLADRLLPMVEGRREERWLAGQSWSSANREMGRPGDKIIALRDRLDLKNASGG